MTLPVYEWKGSQSSQSSFSRTVGGGISMPSYTSSSVSVVAGQGRRGHFPGAHDLLAIPRAAKFTRIQRQRVGGPARRRRTLVVMGFGDRHRASRLDRSDAYFATLPRE